MSLVDEITAQLGTGSAPFKKVEGVVDFASVDKTPNTNPVAYVFIREEASAENSRANGSVLQRTEADVVVLVATRSLSKANMGDAKDPLETLKAFVRDRLIGFEPTVADEPLEHLSGQIISARHSWVWHEETFAAAYYQESTQ